MITCEIEHLVCKPSKQKDAYSIDDEEETFDTEAFFRSEESDYILEIRRFGKLLTDILESAQLKKKGAKLIVGTNRNFG